ncbi:ArnT family glycosyltransferase [Cerasicoccus arenae]|uniref:Glycosyltransferase RgtA/B/C/D-like domain-containing protein n=1 Tax=Cerasicoccus arenae TaxID=424488 RepID=A0A8J3DAH4_9BACT|nr:glycosyltransferase family 39 protein [Cerasicoccus arenae]MBK1859538.1 glycosyltransferase family 39 protein [Cerasicoccus arenae]GHB97229.1 hypothetical protein GCM10007047_11550 [Cerasicoccus arenae]
MSESRQPARLVEPMRLLRALLVVGLLGVFGLCALYSAVNKAPTFDEGIHLTAGYSYWQSNDYRLQPENGNFPQRIAAIPLLFQPINQFTHDHTFWKTGNVWDLEWIFFYVIGNDPYWMLFTARAMMVVAAMLIGLLVFFYARRLWGYGGGALALTLYCFNPDFLAHGRLVTSDVLGAGAFLGAIWALSWLLKRISWLSIGLTGVAFGLLAVSKYYAVLMVPMVLLLVAAQLYYTKETPLLLRGERVLQGWTSRLGAMIGALVATGLIAWIVLWSFYGFRYTAFNDDLHYGQFFESWEKLQPDNELIGAGIDLAREYHLLPESYVYGFAHVIKHSESRDAFLAGQYSSTGWWYFFLVSFLVKSPTALLAILLLLLVILLLDKNKRRWLRRSKTLPGWVPLIVMALVYGGVALTTTLNIGHRHILPIYIVLFVLLGGLWRVARTRGAPTMALLLVLIAGYCVESISAFPHYLTFFNRLVGGPENGHVLLVDSSLDWGQDLYLLDDWLKENNSGADRDTVTLSYFGWSSVTYLQMDARYWESRGLFNRESYDVTRLEPGLFAISATMLQGVYDPIYSNWDQKYESSYLFLISEMSRLIKASPNLQSALAFVNREGPKKWYNKMRNFEHYRAWRLRLHLLTREPEVVLGNTIFIFRLTEDDVKEMLIMPEIGFPDDFPTRKLFDQCRFLAEQLEKNASPNQ